MSSAAEKREKLKRHPSEVHLRELSNEIGSECDRLATYLGFKKSELDQLYQNHRGFGDRVFNMLVNWKQRNFKKCDLFHPLCDALGKCSRNDLVCRVEEWRKEPHKSRDIVEEEVDEPDSASNYSPTSRPELQRMPSYNYRNLEEQELRDLAVEIGSEWEKFATFLGLKATEVYKIKLSNIDAETRVFEVLVTWQRRMAKNTNMVKTLAKALEDSGRNDLKEKLLEKAGYRYNEEKKKEDAKRDLLELYNLPPFLGEIMSGYEKMPNPTIPLDLFISVCVLLDPLDPLGNDWRKLAERLDLSSYISYLASQYKEGPTSGVLWCWMKKEKSLEELAETLDKMERGDVALKIREHLGIDTSLVDDEEGQE